MAEVIGLAASVVSVVDLFVKVGVLCSVYCADLRQAPRDVRHILNEADKLTVTLKDVERLLAGPNGAKIDASQNVQRGIADCRRQLFNLAVKLEEGTRYKKIIWPLKKEEVIDILKDLERCRIAISLDLQVNQAALLLDVHQDVVLAKLRTVEGAAFDSYTETENARCHPGTRVDILQKIQAWGAACDGEYVFWLNGMAGTGKSTISRSVAQSFADKGILGASFFFKRGEGDRGRAAFFFTTIAVQLVHRLPSLAVHIREAIKADPAINAKPPKDQFDKLIASPINKLPKHLQPSMIVVVVDALDECDTLEHARLIIQLLSQASHSTSVRLKSFVTSRPELPIRLGFEDIKGEYKDLVLHQIPMPVIEHDIAAFLQYELAKIRHDYNKSVTSNRQLPPNWPGTGYIQNLVDVAIPLFIFAATVCRFIEDRRLGSPKDLLMRILERQISRKSNLDATYLPVLDQLLVRLTEPEKREVVERFKQVIGSIVILASPLSRPSLARLLGVSPDTIESQLDLLHSVLSIPPDPNIPVRLLHLSFREFLIDPEKANEYQKYPFWVDERETHERLATQCLQLLSTGDTLRKDIRFLQGPGKYRAEIDQQTIDAILPPEVQYACLYWVFHWKGSKCRIRDGDHVDRFLTHHLLYWLDALGLLGRASESIGMVDDLSGLLDLEDSRNISALLRDARRVILSYSSITDKSPLQVYSSAIIFAPEQSIIQNTFQNQFLDWNPLLPHVDSEWDACIATLEGHSGGVFSVALSHDAMMLASASDDGVVKLWGPVTDTSAVTLRGHNGGIRSVVFSHDAKMLASAADDGTIRLWDPITGTSTASLRGHNGWVLSVAFSHDAKMLASASTDGTVKLWDLVTGTSTATLREHNGGVRSVAFSRDANILASASTDGTVKLWNPVTGTSTATFRGHNGGVRSVVFSHDAKMLASASDDGTIRLWDPVTGTSTATLQGHSGWVLSVAFSPDTEVLVSASTDGTVKFWDPVTGACTATIDVSTSTNHLDFNATSGPLPTNVDIFTVGSLQESLPATPVTIHPPVTFHNDCQGAGLGRNLAQVTRNSRRVMWPPPVYRPRQSAVMKSTVALGCPSGCVIIIAISCGNNIFI